MYNAGERLEFGARTGPGAASVLPTSTTVVPRPARTRVPLVVTALVLVTLGYLAVLATSPGGSEVAVRISDITTTAAAVVASVTCALAGRRHAGSMRAFWWLLAAACGAWTSGEVIWSWYELVLHVEVPYPSWADVGYLAGTPLADGAFACHPAAHSHPPRRVIPILDGVAVASALLFVSWTLVLGTLWDETGGMSLGDLVSVAYPFGDVVILTLVVLALRSLESGNRPATAMLLGGLLVMAVTDSAYTYLAQVDGYSSGDLIDAGWFASYLAIAAAALVYESPVDAARSQAAPGQLMPFLAPTVPVLVALGVIAVEVPRGAALDRVEWGIALCLTVVVLARQLLYVVQRSRAFRPTAHTTSRPAPSGRHRGGPTARAAAPAAALAGQPVRSAGGTSADTRAELRALTLQIVAAARPSAQERVSRVSSSVVMVLTSLAGALAFWDLSLLVRGAG